MNSDPKSKRPRIELPLTSVDYVLEALAALGLVLLLMTMFRHFGVLPDTIPSHFGIDGKPNAYHSKGILWILPAFAGVLYLILSLVNRRPDRFNYNVNITEENAERQYYLGTRILRAVKAFAMLLFAFIVRQVVLITQGEAQGLGSWVIPVLLAGMIGLVLYFWTNSTKNK